MLQDGQSWLAAQFKANLSQPATYRRGTVSTTLRATVGPARESLGSPFGGAQIRRADKEFIVTAADLTLGDPVSGDFIDLAEQGVTKRFMVVQPDEGAPVFEPVDAYGYQVRIHAKFLKAI